MGTKEYVVKLFGCEIRVEQYADGTFDLPGIAWMSHWGTALKPALEPILLMRKPLEGTYAENVLKYGTGGINVDACRVPGEPPHHNYGRTSGPNAWAGRSETPINTPSTGRWPANVIHDGSPEVLQAFPTTNVPAGYVINRFDDGAKPFGGGAGHKYTSVRAGEPSADRSYAENGSTNFAMKPGARREPETSAARFFNTLPITDEDYVPFLYCSKAARKEREAGLETLPSITGAEAVNRQEGSAGMNNPRAGAGRTAKEVKNTHPTVKSVALMEWLIKLITPPGGCTLDPFLGSGTTGVAAVKHGFGFVGIDLSAEYVKIAQHRIAHALPLTPKP